MTTAKSPSYITHCSFYFLYYAYLGLFRPFIPSFLDNVGLEAKQIGNIFVLISLATVVAAPTWGRNADAHETRSTFLTFFPLIAAAIMLPLILFPGYYQAMLIACVQGSLVVPLIPLADTACIERCKMFGWKYGRIRLWGTVGFLVTSSVGGFLAESFGWEWVMYLMLAIVCCLAVGGYRLRASSLGRSIRQEGLTTLAPKSDMTRRKMVMQPVVILFLMGTVLYQTAFGAYNLFFGIHLEQLTHTSKWISIAWTIATASEVVFFGIADSFLKKVGPALLMGIAMLCAVLRWFVLAYTNSLPAILVLQVLHGVMLGGFVTGAVMFASQLFPQNLKTFAQGLHNAAYNGVGGVFAALVGSSIFADGGAHLAFLFSAGISFVSIICLAAGPILWSVKSFKRPKKSWSPQLNEANV